MQDMNNLDITITKGVLFFEKWLKKDLHNGPWSEEFQNLILHLSYWRLVTSQILTRISHKTRINIIIKEFSCTFNTSYHSTSNAFKNESLARKKLRETIANSHNIRYQHLFDLALALELDSYYTKRNAIKQLITIENQRRLHSTIKHHFNPISKLTLSSIEFSINAKDWTNSSKGKYIQGHQSDWRHTLRLAFYKPKQQQ